MSNARNIADVLDSPSFTGTVTAGGINFEDYYETETYDYLVSKTESQTLLWGGNQLQNGGTYRFSAHISGTGTDNAATAVYWRQNSAWKMNVTCQSGTNSNHPQFILKNGVPTLIHNHEYNYTVHVYGERMNLKESTGSDNGNLFGADGYMGSVNRVLRYNPDSNGGTFDTGHIVWHTGNHGPGSGLDADTVDGIEGASFLQKDPSGKVIAKNGLLFGTDTSADNTLDDYEQGTFTPYIGTWVGTAPTTDSRGLLLGSYTKIGRSVTCQINISSLWLTGTTSGIFVIKGFPFVPSYLSSSTMYQSGSLGAISRLKFARKDNKSLAVISNVGVGIISANEASWYAWENNSIVQGGSIIRCSITYFTDA